MFVVARHAHAGSKSDWPGPDADRPLSARGHRQALALAQVLAALPLRRLWSSPAARCQQTLEPLAALVGLPVEDHPLLLPEADPAELSDFLASWAGQAFVVCTHGETIGRLRQHWQDVPTIGAPADGRTAKGAAWFVHGSTGGDRTLQYLGSDPPPPLARPA